MNALSIATDIANLYAQCPVVEAVALAGSYTTGCNDSQSDIDLYVYAKTEIPLDVRKQVCVTRSRYYELDNRFWEPGDEWFDLAGLKVDVMFRTISWIEERISDVLDRHIAATGYSTCFWHNIVTCRILFDRTAWLKDFQMKSKVRYPQELQDAIIAKNYPILRTTSSSYYHQISNALLRNDLISLNHRIAAFLASYFDIIFALNQQPHPGEKRLLALALSSLTMIPSSLAHDIDRLLMATPKDPTMILDSLRHLGDELDELLIKCGCLEVRNPTILN